MCFIKFSVMHLVNQVLTFNMNRNFWSLELLKQVTYQTLSKFH